jgi:RNA polymerase sigma factor (sigma-70 family)
LPQVHFEHDQRAGRSAAVLSALIARGDRGALGELYELWFPRLLVAARRALGGAGRDESFCLDVVQECMLRVARSMKAMETDGDVERWMMRVVHTTAIDLLRREVRRRRRQERAEGMRPAAEQRGEGDMAERLEWLQRELREMPEEDGLLLRLRFEAERTLAAAGAAAGISGHAVHGRIRRALARLRERGSEDAS